MIRQFVTEVGVYSIAFKSKKAQPIIDFAKRFEHALLTDDEELPSKALYREIKKLCADADKDYPRTQPLIVHEYRSKCYSGMMTEISVKPARKDGSFSDSYWIMIKLIDVKNEFDLSLERKGGDDKREQADILD